MAPMNRENTMTTAELVKEIQLLQNIQKTLHHSHPEWKKASEQLAPRFAEMARRQAANGGELDWQKWQ